MGFCFHKNERLSSVSRIQKLFKEGKIYRHGNVKLFIMSNLLDYNRILFTFPRKYGTAVQRNKSKRFSKEAYRIIKNDLKKGFDFILLVYPGYDSFKIRFNQIYSLFLRANILQIEK